MKNIRVKKGKIPYLKWFYADDATGQTLLVAISLIVLLEDGTEEELLCKNFDPPIPAKNSRKITLDYLFPENTKKRNAFHNEIQRVEASRFEDKNKPVLRVVKP